MNSPSPTWSMTTPTSVYDKPETWPDTPIQVQDPTLPHVWGSSFWKRNHRYVNAMTDTSDSGLIAQRMARVIDAVADLPCSACSEDSMELLRTIQPLRARHVAKQGNIAYWMFTRHNLSNLRHGRKLMGWNEYKTTYMFAHDPEADVVEEQVAALMAYAHKLHIHDMAITEMYDTKNNNQKVQRHEDPTLPGVWGPAFWERNHRYANAIDDNADEKVLHLRVVRFVEAVTDLPCPSCAADSVWLLQYIQPLLLRHVSTRGNAAYWMYTRHNMSNVKNNRKIMEWVHYKMKYAFDWDPEPEMAAEQDQALTRYALALKDNKTDLPLIGNYVKAPPTLFTRDTTASVKSAPSLFATSPTLPLQNSTVTPSTSTKQKIIYSVLWILLSAIVTAIVLSFIYKRKAEPEHISSLVSVPPPVYVHE